MRILLPTIRDLNQIGGVTTHVSMLERGLRELGHEADSLYLGAKLPTAARKAGIVWPAGGLNRLRSGWGMVYASETRSRLLARMTEAELNRAGSPWEVLNAQEVYSIPYLRAVADRHRIPLVLTLHGYPLYESVSEGYSKSSKMGLNYLMRTELRALRLADAVVTVDTRLYKHALQLIPEREETTHTLMNFIDTTAFAPIDDPVEAAALRSRLRDSWNVPQDAIVLLCPRRLVKKNGVTLPSLALAAMKPEDRARFVLLHAGEGGEREEIEQIIREKGLSDCVRLLGGQNRKSILELYRLADIVLVPSVESENVEEATSLSALEAMASGRPLIAGNVGGLAEMVNDGENGLLVPADAEAIAATILGLAADHELGARMAAAARRYVVENHSHLRAAAEYAEVYRLAVERLNPKAAVPAATSTDAAAQAGATTQPQPAASKAANPWESISVLGLRLDLVGLEQAANWIVATAEESSRTDGELPVTRVAASFNPELVMKTQSDPRAAEALLAADLCYADGVGAVWAAKRQGARLTDVGRGLRDMERVAGIDLAQRVLQLAAAKDLPVFFLGAAEGIADEAARRQEAALPGLRIVGCHHGYFGTADEADVVRAIRESGARILLVAMGAPRQEIFLQRHKHGLGPAAALGVGGSFNVWSGNVKRAPEWTQRARVEWLYRLASDPRRLRRQMVLPRYAAQVLRWYPGDYEALLKRSVARNGDAQDR